MKDNVGWLLLLNRNDADTLRRSFDDLEVDSIWQMHLQRVRPGNGDELARLESDQRFVCGGLGQIGDGGRAWNLLSWAEKEESQAQPHKDAARPASGIKGYDDNEEDRYSEHEHQAAVGSFIKRAGT